MDNKIIVKGKEYYTNDNGEGVFVWQNGSYKQLIGTCDFNVNNVDGKKEKLRRFVRNL